MCLCPPRSSTSQFLRNSLKKTRGTSWSLRLSKELNNQIETFDSPSLEKVCPHRDLVVQAGRDHQRWEGPPEMGGASRDGMGFWQYVFTSD